MENNLKFEDETYAILGVCFEVYNKLGHGFLEIIYKDAIEWESDVRNIPFEREKKYAIKYKNVVLRHHFYADFVLFENIILEVKSSKEGINSENIAQTINYLKVSECKVALIVNFGSKKLEYRRLIL